MTILILEGVGIVVMGVLCVAASFVGHPSKEDKRIDVEEAMRAYEAGDVDYKLFGENE